MNARVVEHNTFCYFVLAFLGFAVTNKMVLGLKK
jgi:hypothetical protein